MQENTLSKSFTRLASLEELFSYSAQSSFISSASESKINNFSKHCTHQYSIQNFKREIKIHKVQYIPLNPPPRTSHISFKASRSRLLFSSLGTPSEGVISPTIAVKQKIHLKHQSFAVVKNCRNTNLLFFTPIRQTFLTHKPVAKYNLYQKNILTNKPLAKYISLSIHRNWEAFLEWKIRSSISLLVYSTPTVFPSISFSFLNGNFHQKWKRKANALMLQWNRHTLIREVTQGQSC